MGPGAAPPGGESSAADRAPSTLAASPTSAPAQATLEAERFELAVQGSPPIFAAYRDLTTLAVQPGAALLVLGEGDGQTRVILDALGDRLGLLVGELRERRTRQRLTDALVQLPPHPLPLLEYQLGPEHGVAQLAVYGWGAELVPIDERLAPRRIRRAGIAEVRARPEDGTVDVDGEIPFSLLGLGASATAWAQRLGALRDAALGDAARLVAGLVPDAPFATRQRLDRLLVDGRPVAFADLGPDGLLVDGAVLTEPTFAASFRELLRRGAEGPSPSIEGSSAGVEQARHWFAMAPEQPGTDKRKAWYLVALPGNLLALELVSEGAHATYLFRIVPRAEFASLDRAALAEASAAAASAVSEALVDARFLREPMALPPDQLSRARYLRYRLALAALPSLAEARSRFVARLVHDDLTRWEAALDDLIAWHAAARDEAAIWPGRTAEEAAVAAVGASDETEGRDAAVGASDETEGRDAAARGGDEMEGAT